MAIECKKCGAPIGRWGRFLQWLLGKRGPHKCGMLMGSALTRAIDGYEQQAVDNYEVSREIQIRDGVDKRGHKVKPRTR